MNSPGWPTALPSQVPILRLFKARAKAGCESALGRKLVTTSSELVSNHAGILGYFACGLLDNSGRNFMFVTVWRDALALQDFFGPDWQNALLPPGYPELIDEHSVEHYQLGGHYFRAGDTGS